MELGDGPRQLKPFQTLEEHVNLLGDGKGLQYCGGLGGMGKAVGSLGGSESMLPTVGRVCPLQGPLSFCLEEVVSLEDLG